MSKQGTNKSSETIFSIVVCVIVLGIATSYASTFWEQWRLNQEGGKSLGYRIRDEQSIPRGVIGIQPVVVAIPSEPILGDSF